MVFNNKSQSNKSILQSFAPSINKLKRYMKTPSFSPKIQLQLSEKVIEELKS